MNSFSQRLLLALSTGVLLSIAHGWWGTLAWLAPVPLLAGLRAASAREALWMGIVCGLSEAMILFGLAKAGLAVFVTLACAYALERAVFTLAVRWFGKHDDWALATASLWILLEAGHAALPMSLPNLIGDTQHDGFILPLARLGGTWLISFVMVWTAALMARAWGHRPAAFQRVAVPVLCSLMLLGLASVYTPARGKELKVGLVQGGIPSWLYQRSHADAQWRDVPAQIYQHLTESLPATDLVIWPEAPLPYRWGEGGEFEGLLAELGDGHRPILTGAFRAEVSSIVYNAALLFDGEREQWVDKRRLALEAELWLTPGSGLESLLMPNGTHLGVVFCVESVMPRYARELVSRAGADLLVVLADGSRFGTTPVGRLHAQRSGVRAMEMGRTVIHAGQHGYSTIYRPDGTSEPSWPLFTAKAAVLSAPEYSGLTPFVRWPYLLVQVAGLLLLGVVGRSVWARAKSAR